MGDDCRGAKMHLPLLPFFIALALGLAVRLPFLFAPLQCDEFNTLFEIASRRTATEDHLPGSEDPLRLLENAAEVRARAVLPYGVRSPHPIFQLMLHALLGPLPLAEWSLRLPSLVAGLASVVVLALIAQRLAGPPAGVAAAFLAALEPMLVVTSVTARPYAIAGLAITLSFLLHPVVLAPVRGACLCGSAVGYGIALALTGYMNPVLSLVVVAHFLLAVLIFARQGIGNRGLYLRRAAAWAAGAGIALLLALPLTGYIKQLGRVSHSWRVYLSSPCDWLGSQLRPLFFLEHNVAVLLLLLACAIVWMASRLRRNSVSGERSIATAAESLWSRSGPGAATLLGATWLVAPQVAAVMLHLFSGNGIFLDRYLFYTAEGSVLLVAGIVAGRATAAARQETAVFCAITLLLLVGFRGIRGDNRMTDRFPVVAANTLTALDELSLWESEDILLFHSSLIEADLLPDIVPEPDQGMVRQALLAPLSTLYVGASPRHALALSKTLFCGSDTASCIGRRYELQDRFYGEHLATKLRTYPRQWFLGLSWDSPEFLSCFLPWLADNLNTPLTVSLRSLQRPGQVIRTLHVSPGLEPWTSLPMRKGDNGAVLALIERTP